MQGQAGGVGTWGSIVGAGEVGGPIVIGVSPPQNARCLCRSACVSPRQSLRRKGQLVEPLTLRGIQVTGMNPPMLGTIPSGIHDRGFGGV